MKKLNVCVAACFALCVTAMDAQETTGTQESFADHLPIEHDHGPHGNLAPLTRQARQFERLTHEVGVHCSLNTQLYGLVPHEATRG